MQLRKESVLGSVLAVLGVGLGFINSGYLQPKILTLDEIGILRYFISLASIVAAFTALGIPPVLNKYFPKSQQDSYTKELTGFVVISTFVGLLFGVGTLFLYLNFFQDELANTYFKSVYHIYVGVFLINAFASWLNVHGKTSISVFSREVVVKIGFVLALIAMYFFVFNFSMLLVLIEIVYYLGAAYLLYCIIANRLYAKIGFNFSKQLPLKAICALAAFSILSSAINYLKKDLDILMVSRLIGFEANGIYTVMLFFAILVEVPSRGLNLIAPVKLGQAWAENDRNLLSVIYHKTSQNQIFVCGLVFLLLILNLDAAFALMPKGASFATGVWVVFWLGLGHFVHLSFGVSGHILYYSKKYIFGFYFSLIMLVFLVCFNFAFIPVYGMNGAAFATFLSQFVVNFLRWAFLHKHFQLQPFTWSSFKAVILFVVLLCFVFQMKHFFQNELWIWQSVIGSVVICLAYLLVITKTNWAPDLQDRLNVYQNKIFKK